MRKFVFILILSCFAKAAIGQVILEANGPGKTYERIDSALAPNNQSVESPDQCASHPQFGRHIAEVWDSTLNKYVFEFYIHVPKTAPPYSTTTADNDRCMNFDRQRVEIKTYDPSPKSLKGLVGDVLTYSWKFRLPKGFKPSPNFTHIHQIKPVNGDDGVPLFTLTPRYQQSGNLLQLVYYVDSNSNGVYLSQSPLSNFLGEWVDVKETLKLGANGTYSIVVKRIRDNKTLINYSSSNILTFRSSNTFVRPKWGIYRSLQSYTYLRDDSIRFASFSLFKGDTPKAPINLQATLFNANTGNLTWQVNDTFTVKFRLEMSTDSGKSWTFLANLSKNATSYSATNLLSNTYYGFRIRSENPTGNSPYSNVAFLTTKSALAILSAIQLSATQESHILKLTWRNNLLQNISHYDVEYLDVVNNQFVKFGSSLSNGTNNIEIDVREIRSEVFRVKAILVNGLEQVSNIVHIKASVNDDDILIFPSIVTSYFDIKIKQNIKPLSFDIYNSEGKIIMQKPCFHSTTVNVSHIPKGVYLVVIRLQNGFFIKKRFLKV